MSRVHNTEYGKAWYTNLIQISCDIGSDQRWKQRYETVVEEELPFRHLTMHEK